MPASNLVNQSSTSASAQKYHVLIIDDFKGKRSIPLSYATYSLGRDENNSIQLHDPAISRHHLILLRVPKANREYVYRVVDGDANGKPSLNGITVNGTRCASQDLTPGDVIQIGEITSITYHVQSMTNEEFDWYFNRKSTEYRSIQEEAIDPVGTMTTILAK